MLSNIGSLQLAFAGASVFLAGLAASLFWEGGPDAALTGLYNEGNTCFANSLLQAFSASPKLASFIQRLAARAHDLRTP
jgi:hypothetical protein